MHSAIPHSCSTPCLREAGGTGVEQEWGIALCIVACVGQTPTGSSNQYEPVDLKMALE